MTDRARIWQQAAALFDELVDMPPDERDREIERRDIPDEVRSWLVDLLAGHDADQTTIIDREIDRLVEELVPGEERLEPTTQLVGQRFGPWRANEVIGRGGMGIVLAGERADDQFDMKVAIKLLDPGAFGTSLTELFRREVHFLAKLSHPGIAQLLDGGLTDHGTPYLVMEHIDGRPIDQYCNEESLGINERLAIFKHVADAVAYCHRHLVVHGDIKPGNVLVDADGLVRLLDFGIASRLASGGNEPENRVRLRWCSPGHAAPERMAGAPATVAEDVFALGALLYQLLTGARIRSAQEMTRLLRGKVPDERPVPVSQRAAQQGLSSHKVRKLAGDLEAIIDCALADEPDRRYRTVEALLDDLERWRQSQPVLAREGGGFYRLSRWWRRHRVGASAGLIAFAALVFGTGVAIWQAEKAREQTQRAEQALAETRQSLDRVTNLREFVIDLFASAEPTRPADELPSTREILRSGARQALNEDTELSTGERFEMLLTLGRIHDALNLRDEARELLETAVSLARDDDRISGSDLARALRRLAWVVGAQGDIDDAITIMDEAIEAARSDDNHGLALDFGAGRAFLFVVINDIDTALNRLESLRAGLADIEQPEPHVVYSVMNASGIAFNQSGDLEAANEAYRQAVAAAREAFGRNSANHAMTMANLAGTKADLGRFHEARDRLREVISLYREIYQGQPTDTLGASLQKLARLEARLGRFDKAMALMDEGSRIWARSISVEPEKWHFLHRHRGWLQIRAHRWEAALASLQESENLLREDSAVEPHDLADVLVLQALALCRLDRGAEGAQRLDEARTMLDGERFPAPVFDLGRLEAIAACGIVEEDWGEALAAIEQARSMADPGWILIRTDLSAMAARALDEMGRSQQALQELAAGRDYLEELDIPAEHPATAWLAGP